MENLGFLLEGFATAATPLNLLLALIGVLVGTAVGVLPGIGPAMTIALLLPITYSLEPTGALIMLAGILRPKCTPRYPPMIDAAPTMMVSRQLTRPAMMKSTTATSWIDVEQRCFAELMR